MSTYHSIDDVRGDERIDSRDLIELRDELRAQLEDIAKIGERFPGERDEMIEAIAAIDELEQVGLEDWQYGAAMIREDTFEDYARELAEDVGAIKGDEQWPANCIDWGKAATMLAMDYTSVDFLGYSYNAR